MSPKWNNRLFGNDSFDITGNYNQKVDIQNKLASDRGGKYVLVNATKIFSDKNFELTLALEPFIVREFWRKWKIIMFGSWIILALLIVNGLKQGSKGENIFKNMAYKSGILAGIVWILELIDLFKDIIYLFSFPHTGLMFFVLVCSIVIPFAIYDTARMREAYMVANLFSYLGMFRASDIEK